MNETNDSDGKKIVQHIEKHFHKPAEEKKPIKHISEKHFHKPAEEKKPVKHIEKHFHKPAVHKHQEHPTFKPAEEKKPVKHIEKHFHKPTVHKNHEHPTLKIVDEKEIAHDFAAKVYQKFNKLVKSIVLFGSQTKHTSTSTSDIDIIIIVDDASVKFDGELVAWYREELGKLTAANPYKQELHINTIKLTTWWQDLLRGDPVVINVLRFGEPIIDFGGFFTPIKLLLQDGKIKSTPEAIYAALQRAPGHFARSKMSELGAIEGLYWCMVDSAHAALMAAKLSPPSPEHVPIMLKETFVDNKILSMKYVVWYRDLYLLHRKVVHGEINDLKAQEIDDWQKRTDDFLRTMIEIVNKLVS